MFAEILPTGNGGSVTHPMQSVPELGLTFMMGTDPEGHVIEAISRP